MSESTQISQLSLHQLLTISSAPAVFGWQRACPIHGRVGFTRARPTRPRRRQQSDVVRRGRAMQIDTTTEALLCAIKSDVRQRVDDIVDRAEQAAMTLDSERQVEELLELALVRVEEAIAEAARAMAREIHRDRAS